MSFGKFLEEETGAVTVDWVVLTAGVVVFAVLVMPPIQTVPPPPPGPPPIPLKYIGLLELGGGDKVAAFSDCRSTMRAKEGDVVAGQYRLVKIGVESVVMEYVDGRGRTTIRLSGQECVGK